MAATEASENWVERRNLACGMIAPYAEMIILNPFNKGQNTRSLWHLQFEGGKFWRTFSDQVA